MSTTVATATTATATVTSTGGATSSTPTSSTATTSATSTPVSSTATSSAPTATQDTVAAAPGTPFATPFDPGGAPFVTPLPSCLMPESFTCSVDFEDYLQQINTAALLSGWFSPSHDNRPHYFAPRLRGNALHFYTTLSAAQQTDFNLLVDAFLQNYTTNVGILKARLKAARQQPNQDISTFLWDIRTLARRAYRAFSLLVEQIVLTIFIKSLSHATLRWELRKSKPATADDVLALAMELNFFLEIEKGAPSTSKMAETSVNAISRETPEPPAKEWVDELVRTLTEGFKNAMPKPSQEGSRQRNCTPNRNQPSLSNSTDSQGTCTVRFQKNSNGGRNTNNRHNNWRGSNRQITNSNQPNDNKNSSKGPCKHCKSDNHASNECKACFKCGKIGHFRNDAKATQQFKLKASTPEGQQADRDTSPGPQVQTLNSVVDHWSVFIQIKIFDCIIEAICDSGASVACLSSETFDSLILKHSLKLEPALRQLKAANQLPIQTWGVVRLPISLGGRKFEVNFRVLAKLEANCLIGLDFLEDHQRDPLFSKETLRVNDDTFVFHCTTKFIPYKLIRSSEFFLLTMFGSIPAGQSMIIPADDLTSPHPMMEAPTNRVGRRIGAARTVQGRQRDQCWPCLVQFRRTNNTGDGNKHWGWRGHVT